VSGALSGGTPLLLVFDGILDFLASGGAPSADDSNELFFALAGLDLERNHE
jgi:hypothetical protein